MPSPHVLILRAPGTNCDQETAYAFQRAGGTAEAIHVNRLLEEPSLAKRFQILCLPGGFSYGDDISAGRILANQMRHHLFETLGEFKERGGLVLGICNGFQILIKSGLLLPDRADAPAATLTNNDSGKYEDRWVNLRASGEKCVFLRGVSRMYLPVAHGEGKFMAASSEILAALDRNGQLALRYCDESGGDAIAYPAAPNGAQLHAAGVCDDTGRVFGLMPHPERHIDPTHHPRWTRMNNLPAEGDGLKLFRNAVEWFA